jgi:hypothetical protein
MENAFKRQKDEFKKRLNHFIITHRDEMDPVFISNWKGAVEIGYSSDKYGFNLPGLFGEKAQNAMSLISADMQKKISFIFDSIYNK